MLDRTDDPRWQAVLDRDAAADGQFVYSVASTGVYCRPTCPSRRPARKNVAFHASCAAAEAAGFRPCRRCQPQLASPASVRAEKIAAAARALEEEPPPPLAKLAKAAGLSPFHFHRLFKAATGLTPRAYAEAAREARARSALSAAGSVTAAIYDAGYSSPRRFYERSGAMLGMSPAAYAGGGPAQVIDYAVGRTSLGQVLVAATPRGLCAILFGDSAEDLAADLAARFPHAERRAAGAEFAETLRKVLAFLEQPRPAALALPLDLQGTIFQKRVWQALQQVPPGTTLSYAELAARLGVPKATRAVASACARNHLAVAVPCHRIIKGDGTLSGYRWGAARKSALLQREEDGD